METHIITILPPLQIIDVGNGCEAYSASIYIPAKSELTTTIQSITRSQFFLNYNFNYTNASKFIIWHKTDFATLTPDEIKTLKAKMLKLPTMPMDIFKKTLKNIDENYPFSLLPILILSLLITVGVGTLIVCILFIWYKRKTSHTTSIVDNLLNLIPSLKEETPMWILCCPYWQNAHYHLILIITIQLSLFLIDHNHHLMNLYHHLH